MGDWSYRGGIQRIPGENGWTPVQRMRGALGWICTEHKKQYGWDEAKQWVRQTCVHMAGHAHAGKQPVGLVQRDDDPEDASVVAFGWSVRADALGPHRRPTSSTCPVKRTPGTALLVACAEASTLVRPTSRSSTSTLTCRCEVSPMMASCCGVQGSTYSRARRLRSSISPSRGDWAPRRSRAAMACWTRSAATAARARAWRISPAGGPPRASGRGLPRTVPLRPGLPPPASRD